MNDINLYEILERIEGELKQIRENTAPKPRKKTSPRYSEWDLTLAQELTESIGSKSAKSRAEDIRLMRQEDGRTIDEIRQEWLKARKHHFWAKNIRSANKLRQHWGKFDETNNNGNSKTSITSQFSETANTNF